MTKRTAVCGVPMYVVRKVLVPLFVWNTAWVVLNLGVWELYSVNLTNVLIYRPTIGLAMMAVFALVPIASVFRYMILANSYIHRMKRLKGRACFVCNYELAEGLDRCSECGAVWSLDDLNRSWRRNVGGE